MVKSLLLSAVAVCMLSATASAQTNISLKGANENIPAGVKAFLQTPVGKNFKAADVMKAYSKGVKKADATPAGVTPVVALSEGFSSLTKGSAEVPDTVELTDSLANILIPGWGAWHIYQAGGNAYESYVDTKEGDPGYLMTPNIDLSGDQGVFRVKMWVKNANPDRSDQVLQYFVMNNDSTSRGIIQAAGLPMSSDKFTECSFTTSGGVKQTTVMLFGWGGKVLVDSVSVERLVYPLNTPQNVKANVKNGSTITASWDAVDGATSYVATLYNHETGDSITSAEVTTNSADLTGDFVVTDGVLVSVVAKNADGESYPGSGYSDDLEVDEVAAPVADEATDVTENGFTANWEKSDNAHTYTLSLVRTHTVTDGTEQVSYFNDGFGEIPYSNDDPQSTVFGNPIGSPFSLDDLIDNAGWSVYLATCFTGYLGITNIYDSYGLTGMDVLYGPEADYSICGGKATVSGTGMSASDDVVVKVGFGTIDENTKEVTFNDGAKEFTLSTTGSEFNEEISGGTANSRLIFKITDAAEGGDVALFDSLSITGIAQKGDTYTLPYATVTLPYNATSYNVEVPFTGNDVFTYSVTGEFGTQVSNPSNVITVYAPTYNGISSVEAAKSNGAKEYYTIDGMKVRNAANLHGLFIVRDGNKTYKVVK